MTKPRRLPPPWTIEECNGQCFIVRDASGGALAYVYFEDNEVRRAAARDAMTRDEAWPGGRQYRKAAGAAEYAPHLKAPVRAPHWAE